MHKTRRKYWGRLRTALARKEVAYSERAAAAVTTYTACSQCWRVAVPVNIHHHPMHFYKCQELCVYWLCLTPNIYSAQQHSTQSFLIVQLWPLLRWVSLLHSAVSSGMCNITFLFTSPAAGRAQLQINTDILQRGWIFSCLICIHNATVGMIKGPSLVGKIRIWSYMAANVIYSPVISLIYSTSDTHDDICTTLNKGTSKRDRLHIPAGCLV